MNALESLIRPATAMINRQIAAKTPAREICSELDGRTFALRVRDTGIAIYLTIDDGRIVPSADYADEPDVVATGSIVSLVRLSGPAGESLIRAGAVELSGDALVASRFRKLLQYGQPDIEEALSTVIGDSAAHGIGEFVRGVATWSREAGETMQQNIGEYLQEESRAVPGRHEADSFRADVNALRDDVDRFEAKLRKAEERRR